MIQGYYFMTKTDTHKQNHEIISVRVKKYVFDIYQKVILRYTVSVRNKYKKI